MFTLFAIFLIALAGANAQLPFTGGCPKNIHAQTNFNLSAYMGLWYEIERYFSVNELGGRCSTANYTLVEGVVNVVNAQINLDGSINTIEGTAVPSTNDATVAKFTVHFPSVGAKAPYWVLDTDYENYALVYSCVDLLVASARAVWILGRANKLTLENLEHVYSVMNKLNIDTSFLVKIKQNC